MYLFKNKTIQKIIADSIYYEDQDQLKKSNLGKVEGSLLLYDEIISVLTICVILQVVYVSDGVVKLHDMSKVSICHMFF